MVSSSPAVSAPPWPAPHPGSTRSAPSAAEEGTPEPFVILATAPWGEFTVPAASARAAQTAARHLAECYPDLRAGWRARLPPTPGPVIVFGCARSSGRGHLLDQQAHLVLLTPAQPSPPVWTALCGRRIQDAHFDVLDPGMGRPCTGCRQRWATHHRPTRTPWTAPQRS